MPIARAGFEPLFLDRFVSDGGDYTDYVQGIALGSPLSPLMGALFLKPLDDRMADLGFFYVRYMDDWVVLAPTRWKLRRAIRAVNLVMERLQVVKHPDKTFIGRIAKGFDFLGYWFSPEGLTVAKKTVDRMLEKVSRLYEQGASVERIGVYVRRWVGWVRGGINGECADVGRRLWVGIYVLVSIGFWTQNQVCRIGHLASDRQNIFGSWSVNPGLYASLLWHIFYWYSC